MLRGDLERCLIVAPGGLVEQWQDELREKFGMSFELLTRQLADAEPDGSVFAGTICCHGPDGPAFPFIGLQGATRQTDWDLVVVDGARRMSAHYLGSELKKTKRYQLGELLGRHARHFLLMTATRTRAAKRTSSCSWRCWTPTGSKAATGTRCTR